MKLSQYIFYLDISKFFCELVETSKFRILINLSYVMIHKC